MRRSLCLQLPFNVLKEVNAERLGAQCQEDNAGTEMPSGCSTSRLLQGPGWSRTLASSLNAIKKWLPDRIIASQSMLTGKGENRAQERPRGT